jgi:hypothetical protein
VRRKCDKGYSTPDKIGVGKVNRKSVAMRETEPEREVNLGRRGMMELTVWRIVRQKIQGQVHEGGRKSRNVYTLRFHGNLDIRKLTIWLC